MRKRKKLIKKMLILNVICTMTLLSSVTIANASNSTEGELKSIIQNYNQKDVIVEDGISLHIGETKDLSQHPDWNLSNNSVVSIDKNGQLKAIGSGTVFISQKLGNKLHVIEIYVPDSSPRYYSFYKAEPKSRNYYKVFIDPGHGGDDSGAPGLGSKNEDDLNLEVAMKVKKKLEAKNIDVKMSRESDEFIKLGERANMANQYGADVFVSIHQNSADAESAHGIETYYHPNKGMYEPLAKDIQDNAINQTGARNRGVKSSNLAVLRESNMPSSLFESGFVSNLQEYQKLINPSYQDKLATGIVEGIETYLKNNIQLDGQDLPVINTGVVTTDGLNVRSGVGTSYPVIGTLSNGNKVDIVETIDGWHKIKYRGSYGYVSGKYIQIDSKTTFNDIDGHWAKNAIIDFATKGYINGYGDGTFKPDNSITRAEFVKILNKAFGYTNVGKENFSDVNPSDWYYNDICIGVNAGYINGYEDNTFKPDKQITREEASKIIATALNLNGDGKLNFKDSSEISNWAKPYVDALSDNNIINGYEDNTFRPHNNMTRAENVTILSRAKH
ncbi:Mg-chelatase subunit ChlD [[Clostridium] sordellii]|uniref:N-acetylmuramoyl-L-alanine amidase familyprotein n=1 Tax=Paraclostridium sordellii TaxID=1505 RepID=A0ABM9RS79_PARSO|nr:N-acetylmuramoyl-L-alanine amidase [Paeniclostridium sordellii]CEJ74921.1 N-acetylmuramoyl-L-alanine amidase familyprotein [[Clostridium] sordellii] [Paeniclostridium sordellii]CEN70494.1 Mg-chelatase subunit ChlD [[Clostridium] sordellii] [Paeniclostridium sordellii]CEN73784.1 Mg-chelatase subunit ChlD [[Clostridium] sordellii] [Paeniclostridium sordellii]CEO27189.1 Mg-chelatase subunit ChlD [[Clostridium] sordellii] [Paeniclostridium sordellii]CEP65238.1 Mg-chelatase subunit ChlD [[Clostr